MVTDANRAAIEIEGADEILVVVIELQDPLVARG